jgi:hypothetical protein
MRRVFLAMLIGVAFCGSVGAEEGQKSIKAEKRQKSIRAEKRGKKNIVLISGRIKSRHVSFRKGKSVREYYIVTPELVKISLPRSHVEHRDGTISGIRLKDSRGKNVELVCEGRIKEDAKKKVVVTVKKIISLIVAKK